MLDAEELTQGGPLSTEYESQEITTAKPLLH